MDVGHHGLLSSNQQNAWPFKHFYTNTHTKRTPVHLKCSMVQYGVTMIEVGFSFSNGGKLPPRKVLHNDGTIISVSTMVSFEVKR